MKNAKRLFALFLCCALILPVLIGCNGGGEESGSETAGASVDEKLPNSLHDNAEALLGALTADVDALVSPTVDMPLYMESVGKEYDHFWDAEHLMKSYRQSAAFDFLEKNAGLDASLTADVIAEKKSETVKNVTAKYNSAVESYKAYGFEYPYTLDQHAALSIGYDIATYPTLDSYAAHAAEVMVREMLTIYALGKKAGFLPTESAYEKFYADEVGAIAKQNGTTVAKIEEYYAEIIGACYLRDTLYSNMLVGAFLKHVNESWSFFTPEGTVFQADKTEIDPSLYVETEEETDLVRMHIKSADGAVDGYVYIRLYPETAPLTVAHFKKMVASGAYSGRTFHRLEKDFCLQGGAPTDGVKDESVKGEFALNGVGNHLSHKKGVLSMARAGAYDSASAQFFFILSDGYSHLDGQYAAFGYVVAGWETVEAAAAIGANTESVPHVRITIENAVFVTESMEE